MGISSFRRERMGGADDSVESETKGIIVRRKKHHVSYYIPQELASKILLSIPAQALHDVMRHVCREWDLLIHTKDFTYSHLRNSTGGLIIEQTHPTRSFVYVELRGAEAVEISKPCLGFEGHILNSCNGLVLARLPNLGLPFVINPLTKQRVTLPTYSGHETEEWPNFAIAFVEASMEYKVVCCHATIQCKITVLTIGVDRVWRDICVEHLTSEEKGTLRCSPPLVTGGYIHWTGFRFILTLNVETETFNRFPFPQLQRGPTHFLPMGSNLSLVNQSKELSTYVWKMNPENGEWTIFHCIDMKPLLCVLYDLFCRSEKPFRPLGWLGAAEVLVFLTRKKYGCCIAYNVKAKKILTFELRDIKFWRFFVRPHVKSLVLV